jgi:hypothetical protein
MRKKVSTLLDEALFRRAKLESVRQRKQFSEIVGEALESYLSRAGSASTSSGVVSGSFGSIRLAKRSVKRIVMNEASILDD